MSAVATRPQPTWLLDDWDVPNKLAFYGGDWPSNFNIHESMFVPIPQDLKPISHLLRDGRMPDDCDHLECDNGEFFFQIGKLGGYETYDENSAFFWKFLNEASTPAIAKRMADKRSGVPLPPGWDDRGSLLWMLLTQRTKYRIPRLRRLLLGTRGLILVENAWDTQRNRTRDDKWGARDKQGGWKGQNLLGRAIMRVRDEAWHQQRVLICTSKRWNDGKSIDAVIATLPAGATVITDLRTNSGKEATRAARSYGLAIEHLRDEETGIDDRLDRVLAFARPNLDNDQLVQERVAEARESGLLVETIEEQPALAELSF